MSLTVSVCQSVSQSISSHSFSFDHLKHLKPDISRVLQGCLMDFSRVFQGSFNGVLSKFQGCFREVACMFYESYNEN